MKEIIKAEPLENYELLLTFEDGEKKVKDMKPYLEKGVFKKLQNIEVFKNVKIKYGTVYWDEDIDICADSLYETSKKLKN